MKVGGLGMLCNPSEIQEKILQVTNDYIVCDSDGELKYYPILANIGKFCDNLYSGVENTESNHFMITVFNQQDYTPIVLHYTFWLQITVNVSQVPYYLYNPSGSRFLQDAEFNDSVLGLSRNFSEAVCIPLSSKLKKSNIYQKLTENFESLLQDKTISLKFQPILIKEGLAQAQV